MDRKRAGKLALAFAVVVALLLVARAGGGAVHAYLTESPAERSPPRLALDRNEHDFGTVSRGDVLRIAFTVVNTGGRRLIFYEDGTGCCGQTSGSRHVVAPGESVELPVEVDTSQLHGRVEHTVRYATNDPRLPHFILKVTAHVGDRG